MISLKKTAIWKSGKNLRTYTITFFVSLKYLNVEVFVNQKVSESLAVYYIILWRKLNKCFPVFVCFETVLYNWKIKFKLIYLYPEIFWKPNKEWICNLFFYYRLRGVKTLFQYQDWISPVVRLTQVMSSTLRSEIRRDSDYWIWIEKMRL